MSHSMDNLEKLIQMVTMEQMYNMLHKMKENTLHVNNVNEFLDKVRVQSVVEVNDKHYDNINCKVEQQHSLIELLSSKLETIEKELGEMNLKYKKVIDSLEILQEQQLSREMISDIKFPFDRNYENQFPFNQSYENQSYDIRTTNVQVFDDILESMLEPEPEVEVETVSEPEVEPVLEVEVETVLEVEVETVLEEQHISLKIEEKLAIDEVLEVVVKEEVLEVVVKEEEEEVLEEEDEVLEEEEEEAEVESDNDDIKPLEVISQAETKEEDVKEEDVEEEEEELFEIEIDDVTYYATDEENGTLYDITPDGDVGKKVGIIKDGEPIFN